ncbi:MAG: hypothetical protein EHM79_17880, partial [Geobacter sp.]
MKPTVPLPPLFARTTSELSGASSDSSDKETLHALPSSFTIGSYSYYSPLKEEGMIDRFQNAAETAGAVVRRFSSLADAAADVRATTEAIVAASELPEEIRQALSPLNYASPEQYRDTRACISFARAGIADTGSLLLELSDHLERSASALPPVHLVFLRASSLVPDLATLADTIATLL